MRWQFRAHRFVALIVAMALAFFILASSAGSLDARPTDDRQAEAFDVLERFTGDWTTRAKIHYAGPPPRTIETEGRAECRQTLEGRYFEFRTKTARPVQADLQIMTYDADAAVFRQWVFSSDGYRHEAQGQWYPASSTLRWKGRTGDRSFEIEDRWVSRDRLEWTLRRTDAAGRTVQTIKGTVDRVTTRSYCVAPRSRDQEHQARDESSLDD